MQVLDFPLLFICRDSLSVILSFAILSFILPYREETVIVLAWVTHDPLPLFRYWSSLIIAEIFSFIVVIYSFFKMLCLVYLINEIVKLNVSERGVFDETLLVKGIHRLTLFISH